MAFPGFSGTNKPSLVDDFNRPDNAALGTWLTQVVGGSTQLEIISNQVGKTSGATDSASAWRRLGAFDLWGEVTLADVDTATGTQGGGLAFACSGDPTDTGYLVYADTSATDDVEVWRNDNGSWSQLATPTIAGSFADSDRLGARIRKSGSNVVIDVYHRTSAGSWYRVATVTDTTPGTADDSAWWPGVYLYTAAGWKLDDLRAARDATITTIDFDNTNDALECALGNVDGTGALTLACIAKVDTVSAVDHDLIGVRESGSTDGQYLLVTNNGKLSFGTDTDWSNNSTSALTAGKWYLLVGTRAAGTQTPRLHIYDLEDTGPWLHEDADSTAADPAAANARIQIGDVLGGGGSGCDGRWACGAIWDKVLSDAQVEELANDWATGWLANTGGAPDWAARADGDYELRDEIGDGHETSRESGVTASTDGLPLFAAPYFPGPQLNGFAGFDGLNDTDLQVRYFFDEAASGTTPTQVDDDGGSSYHLNDVSYDAGSGDMEWSADAHGNRALDSKNLNDANYARRQIATSDHLMTNVDGQNQLTLEIVVDIDALDNGTGSRIFGVNDRTGQNGEFMLAASLAASGDCGFYFERSEYRRWDIPTGKHVVHIVWDSPNATAADRCLVYVNGEAPAGYTSVNTVTQNDTLDLTVGWDLIALNRYSGSVYNRSPNGRLYYAAIYTDAMTPERVRQHAQALARGDDLANAVSAGQVSPTLRDNFTGSDGTFDGRLASEGDWMQPVAGGVSDAGEMNQILAGEIANDGSGSKNRRSAYTGVEESDLAVSLRLATTVGYQGFSLAAATDTDSGYVLTVNTAANPDTWSLTRVVDGSPTSLVSDASITGSPNLVAGDYIGVRIEDLGTSVKVTFYYRVADGTWVEGGTHTDSSPGNADGPWWPGVNSWEFGHAWDDLRAEAYGQTVAIGLVTETDTAHVTTRGETTDHALPITAVLGGGITQTVNQVSETDTTQPVAWAPKHRLAAQLVETDSALAVDVEPLRRLISLVTETDLAQIVDVEPLRRLVSQVVETDEARLLDLDPYARLIDWVSETDTAQPISWAPKHRLATLLSETDEALALTSAKTRAVAQLSETDEALPVIAVKSRVLTQLSETDEALPITVAGEKIVAVTQVVETDTAQPVDVDPYRRLISIVSESDEARLLDIDPYARLIDWVTEADLAQPIAWSPKHRLVTQLSETDEALPITALKTKSVALLVETDSALAVDVDPYARLISIVSETNEALALSVGTIAGLVSETDEALAVAWAPKHRLAASVAESDSALPITARKTIVLGQPSESDTPQPTAPRRTYQLTIVSESDSVLAASSAKTRSIAVVAESDEARPIAWSPKHRLVTLTSETDEALVVTGGTSQLVAIATSTESALAITARKTRAVAQLSETDSTLALSRRKTRVLAQLEELDVALSVSEANLIIWSAVTSASPDGSAVLASSEDGSASTSSSTDGSSSTEAIN